LLEGRIVVANAGGIRVDSPIGALVAALDQTFSPTAGSEVWISIRPECLRAAATVTPPSANILRGEVRDDGSLYLGEIAERKLSIGGASITRFELNPTAAAAAATNATFDVSPADVVLLPKEPDGVE
jgi:hypothetical protein